MAPSVVLLGENAMHIGLCPWCSTWPIYIPIQRNKNLKKRNINRRPANNNHQSVYRTFPDNTHTHNAHGRLPINLRWISANKCSQYHLHICHLSSRINVYKMCNWSLCIQTIKRRCVTCICMSESEQRLNEENKWVGKKGNSAAMAVQGNLLNETKSKQKKSLSFPPRPSSFRLQASWQSMITGVRNVVAINKSSF